MLNFDENDEMIKTKSKIYVITILFVIGTIILFFCICFFSIKLFFNSLSMKKEYFVLSVDSHNKDQVNDLFENETKNLRYDINYCNSIYKIEYYHLFPDGNEYTMYCKDEDDMTFGIDKAGEDTLATYIYENGKREIR